MGQRLLAVSPDQIVITIISAEELVRGRLAQIRKAQKPEGRVVAYYWFEQTLQFLQSFKVLGYGHQAEAYFQSFLSQKLRIGTQDLKIAAIAISQDATLLTRNRQDFDRVPGLMLEDWSI